jgi:type I restriction enzyme M protein
VTYLQDLSRRLFAAADQLWTNTSLRPNEYRQPVLALTALRQMETRFAAIDADLRRTFKGRLKPTPADYQARGAIFLPENARFSRLLSKPENANLGAELNAAMEAIAEHNPDLAGALPRGYAGPVQSCAGGAVATTPGCKLRGDVYGLIFEHFVSEFATCSMQKRRSGAASTSTRPKT